MCPRRFLRLLLAVLAAGSVTHAARVERNVPVTMRDGVKLMTDIYRPDADGTYPVLVTRTPYDRKKRQKEGNAFAAAGYIVVTEDVRGRYDSEGDFDSFMVEDGHDGVDGYDTIEWAAKIPGANGKVGTFGNSYDALLQWRAAALKPPSLMAMSASAAAPRTVDSESPGAIRPGRRLHFWYVTMAPDYRVRYGLPGARTSQEAEALWQQGEKQYLWFLPYLDLPDSIWGTAREAEATRAYLRNPSHSPRSLGDGVGSITVPNLCFVGWYDHGNAAIDLRQMMVERGGSEVARKNQRLVIGPWIHSGYLKREIGALDFGPDAIVKQEGPQLRWFDYWMKGKANGADQDAPVRIFVMGKNQWRDERQWPPADTQRRTYFFSSGGKANTPAGDGRLVTAAPATAGTDHYRYDPRDPAPAMWDEVQHTVPADQGLLKHRRDILVYQTEPFTEATEITGYPEVDLYAASSAPDTDFFARLIDVYPDGKAIDICHGMVRASYRDSLERQSFLTPGGTVQYHLRLRPTSIVLPKGHRLRLDVTSSCFPDYDRNHNTATNQNADAKLVPADQTVFHGGAQASRLVVPIIARGKDS